MSTKDYASTTSGWHEPIKFLSIVPMDSPANWWLYNHLPLQQSFISLICKFYLPEQDNLIPDPFEWVGLTAGCPKQTNLLSTEEKERKRKRNR
jgi:hypothetical protein